MDEIAVDETGQADLADPVLVEGLPGVGHVGKLAAEHLVDEYDDDTTLVRRVHSEHLPPKVTVEDGLAGLSSAEFHAIETEGRDLLVLTADHQAQSNEGHYRLADGFLDVAEEFGAEEVYALGGVPTGELIEDYDVIGAAPGEATVERLEDAGVEFRENEPAGGIVGVSGLLLGLGDRRGMETACLMGETSGYLVDPKSAQAVLEALEELLSVELDYSDLQDRAEEMEEVINRIREMEDQQSSMELPGDDDLRYFG
ncbi:proteasome assembly chaperone family protein [Halobacteriales archaeon QS_8_69_26]|nr:MAG: proteasome assembly chaperone family protein [Halobacteriales archaeon QS_8_69_26]